VPLTPRIIKNQLANAKGVLRGALMRKAILGPMLKKQRTLEEDRYLQDA
jgi:hypothetical protein